MIIIDTKFSGLKLFKSNLYNDKRGYLREIFKKKNFNKDLIFHYFAKSKKYVFRGFHFQSINQQEKFVSVLEGSIIDLCLDLRKNSKTFGKNWMTCQTSPPHKIQLKLNLAITPGCKSFGCPYQHGHVSIVTASMRYSRGLRHALLLPFATCWATTPLCKIHQAKEMKLK